MGNLQTKYVWEVPVRVTHWVIVLSIVILSVTGIFIGTPASLAQNSSQFVMGWIRFVHFVTAYVFTVSVFARIYWMFKGNRYANWRAFFPFKDEAYHNMIETFKFYIFISKKNPSTVGHNSLAGAAYTGIFFLYLVMICTGFALYSERAPQSLMHKLTGWLFTLFSSQGIRLTHHMVMWCLIGFAIHHIYSSWLMDSNEKSGIISSIFTGYKTVRKKD